MRVYRSFVAVLLVLFSIGTVHAAAMGVTMKLQAAPESPVMHCHDIDPDAGDNHAKPHHGNICTSCAACVPQLMLVVTVLPALPAHPTQNPHSEASYFLFIAKLLHRPPIAA
jgi:hypothetical protein